MIVVNLGTGLWVTRPDIPPYRLDYVAARLEWDRDGYNLFLFVLRDGTWDCLEVVPAGTRILRHAEPFLKEE